MKDSRQYETILEARSILKRFGGVTALKDGNICIRKGKIGGLLGANGSGKTTLSRILTGIYQPTKGDLFLGGECVQIPSPIFAAENGIVMVHQHLSLIPELTVWENVLLGNEKKSKLGFVRDKEMVDTVESLIGRFNANIDLEESVKNLSQAKRQIVEIAKALSRKPSLLIFDEPTSALEKEEVDSLFTVMRSLKEEGVSMVFTSHRMWEVMEICDYVTVFRNGMFVGEIDFERDGKEERK
ncbi:MAG: ATP-binding cassette domain-containing protein, partial [Spirochaetota bacterium]